MRSFNEGQIKLYEADCKNTLKDIAKESVDLIITSPPYCMRKEYEDFKDDIQAFTEKNEMVLNECIRILKKGGSLCWQVGFHVKNSVIVPLDYIIHNIIQKNNACVVEDEKLVLHNRIIWSFGHGLNAEKRLSGRYETIMWYTKGNNYLFNLDSIRIPQKYPGKKYSKGPKIGQYSGNPLGKNPSDVWDIPNVKANHVEKTGHPCQFPIAIPQRLIKALTLEGDVVVDPFCGSGTTALACIIENRKFIGIEIKKGYIEIASNRIKNALLGDIKYRPDYPVMKPDETQKVAQKPMEFKW